MGTKALPINRQRLGKLLRRMIDIYSPSGKEEQILQYLRGFLRRQGLSALCQEVDDTRFNLVVLPGQGELAAGLVGHVDTVAAYDLDETEYEERDGLIAGLGAADMKGGCAAMVEAFLAFRETRHALPPAALCLLVGEEADGDGAERLTEDVHFPWALIGEPTDMRPCLSSYGYLELQLYAQGRRVHASLADMQLSPVKVMLDTMLGLSHYLETARPELVYNIRDLRSTQGGFVMPDRCEAWLDVHLPPLAPVGDIAAELEEIVSRQAEEAPPVKTSLRIATIDAGYSLPEKGLFVEALKASYEACSLAWKPAAFQSHSDANMLWAAGVKPVLAGPGSLAAAHSPEESVSFDQVCAAAELYLECLMRLAG